MCERYQYQMTLEKTGFLALKMERVKSQYYQKIGKVSFLDLCVFCFLKYF
jgi:hypothetical protein